MTLPTDIIGGVGTNYDEDEHAAHHNKAHGTDNALELVPDGTLPRREGAGWGPLNPNNFPMRDDFAEGEVPVKQGGVWAGITPDEVAHPGLGGHDTLGLARAAAVDVRAHDAVGDGVTNDESAILSAVAAAQGDALIFPRGTYLGTDNNRVSFAGVRAVYAYGATFVNFHPLLDGDDIEWLGGTFTQDGSAVGANSIFRIAGSNVTARDATVLGGTAWTGVEVRDTVGPRPENVRLVNVVSKSRSGMTLFAARGVTIDHCRAESTESDDCFVLKDPSGEGLENVKILGSTAENGAAVCAIGSEVLEGGYVRNVLVSGCHAVNTSKLLYIKPGAISGVTGYANGVVENVTVSGSQLWSVGDPGLMQNPIDITCGRGAVVRNVRVSNVLVVGRQNSTSVRRTFVRVMPVVHEGITGATVDGLVIADSTFLDPHAGAANDPGVVPGFPALDAIELLGDTGFIRNVEISNVTVDGAGGSYLRHDSGATVVLEGLHVVRDPVGRNLRKESGSRWMFDSMRRGEIHRPVYDSSVIATFPTYRLLSVLNSAPVLIHGSGDAAPSSGMRAGRGSTWTRTGGGAGTTFYVKEADDGVDTGWAAK